MRSKCAVPAETWLSWVATARNNVSLTRVDLPEPETPVTQVSNPNGNSAVTFFRLLAVAPRTRSIRDGLGGCRFEGIGMRGALGRRALRNDLAAMDAGARTQVDHVIGLPDCVLVVLDHDDGVAQIAQIHEGVEQTLVVALVQADRRLIEN